MSLLNAKSTLSIRVSVFLTVKALSVTTNQTCTPLFNHPFSFLRHIRSLNPLLSVRQPTLTLHPPCFQLKSVTYWHVVRLSRRLIVRHWPEEWRATNSWKKATQVSGWPIHAPQPAQNLKFRFATEKAWNSRDPHETLAERRCFTRVPRPNKSWGPTLWIASTPLTVKRSYFSSENRLSKLEVQHEVRNRNYAGSRIGNQRNETFFSGRTSIFVSTGSFVGRTGKGIWFRVHDQDQFQRTDFSKLCVRSESHSSDLREAIFIITIYWLDFLLFLSQMEIRYWRKARNWRKFGR